MTLKEVEEALFPCTYKTRNGELVEITGFAFQGHFVNKNSDCQFIWNNNMNFFIPTEMKTRNISLLDLVELVKSPVMDPNHKKNQILISADLPVKP